MRMKSTRYGCDRLVMTWNKELQEVSYISEALVAHGKVICYLSEIYPGQLAAPELKVAAETLIFWCSDGHAGLFPILYMYIKGINHQNQKIPTF